MNKNIGELIEHLQDKLEQNFRQEMMVNYPLYPMAVIYVGENAAKARECVDQVLQQVWRRCSRPILRLQFQGDTFKTFPDQDKAAENLDNEGIQQCMNFLFSEDKCFRDMSSMLVFMVFDTSDYKTLEEFRHAYDRIAYLHQILAPTAFNAMSVILMDEAFGGRALASEVRSCLREIMTEGAQAFNSTCILSNRLNGGEILAGERIKENYQLIGRIIVAVNGIDANYRPEIDKFFPIVDKYYITAAYSHVVRPNRKICEIIVLSILNWLTDKINSGNLLQASVLSQRLGISGNMLPLIENFYKNEVRKGVPSADILEYFPRKSNGEDALAEVPFRIFDNVTMGVFDLFVSQLEIMTKEQCADFSDRFRNYIRQKIKTGEAAVSFAPANIETFLSQLLPVPVSKEVSAAKYLEECSKNKYIEKVLPLCEAVFREEYAGANHNKKVLDRMHTEFENEYVENSEGSLESFYSLLTKNYLDESAGLKLADKFNQQDVGEEDILDSIAECAETIFTTNPIFMLPLDQEMIKRMGQDPINVQKNIKEALLENIEKKIRFSASIAMNMLSEVVMLNQQDDGQDTQLYTYMKDIFKSPISRFVNTENSNSIEVVKLYQCTQDSML